METSAIEHRSVLIIGAGPAGSAAAQRLAEDGIDVLVIEKRQIIGNPAQCGECVPEWGEVIGAFPKAASEEWLRDYFIFPERIKLHPLKWMRIYSPSGKAWEMPLDAFAAHRLQFDGLLADRAMNAGAEIRVNTALTNIITNRKDGKDLYVSNNGKITADVIIDASGSLAHVARLRGGHQGEDQVPTIYAQVSGEIPESFDIFLGAIAPMGYAWIIPKGEGFANVGIGVKAGAMKGVLKEHLKKLCDELNLTIHSWGGGWIPMGGPVKNLVKDNVLAVGDAGGLVMPSNGGGISQAIMSGFYAGETIIQHFNNAMELQNYHHRTMNVMKKSLKTSLRTKKIAYLILRWNWSAELAMRFLGPIGGIRRAVECKKSIWII